MKLEFLPEGSDDCPLIRLYGFGQAEAMRLREAFRALADGAKRSIPLHEEWWIEPLDDCQLELRVSARDLGVVERLPQRFDCSLNEEQWSEMVELMEPFCGVTQEQNQHQWLNKDSDISLLISPSGSW